MPCESFNRSFQRVINKLYASEKAAAQFRDCVNGFVKALSTNPKHPKSRAEPWPSDQRISGWNFRKLRFNLPMQRGAAKKARLMYIYRDDEEEKKIKLVLIYTHAEYTKRPPEKRLKDLLRDVDS